MHILEKISEFVGKWMAVIILAIAALSLLLPKSTLWIEISWVNYLLMIVMFGMGLTLKLSDFALVFARPKEITIGCAAQFIIMPALAFLLSKVFGLDAALMAGVVLVGTCPGGTSSNVITYLSKGDVALSVGMTSVNTLLAPVLTPAITYLLLRTTVNVDVMAMFDQPYEASLELNAAMKSTDQAGPGAVLSVTKKNFLRSAASLSFR